MASIVRLEKQSDTLDLFGGADGIRIRHGGWVPRRAYEDEEGNYAPVEEVLNLRVDGGNANGLASGVQALDGYLVDAGQFRRRTFAKLAPVWLYTQLDGETGGRRSLVHAGRAEPMGGFLGPPVSTVGTVPDYQLGLIRHPFWEADGSTNAFYGLTTHYALSTIGGTAEYNTVPGDVAGRITSFTFTTELAGGQPSAAFYECWAGFRSDEYGDRTKFIPNWDCGDEDVTTHNNTTRLHAVDDAEPLLSTAYQLQACRWVPGGGSDNLMLKRVTLPLNALTSTDAAEQAGTFLVLLRARTTSGATQTFRMRLQSGYYDGSTNSKWATGQRVLVPSSDPAVSAGDWYYYPLGIVSLPPDRVTNSVALMKYFALRIQAEVATSGTGNLEMDTFTLIPINEGAVHLKTAYIIVSSGTTYWSAVNTGEDDEMIAYNVSTPNTDQHKYVEMTPYNFSLPTGPGRVVVAAQQESSQVKTDNIGLGLEYFPRWLTLRGSE